MSGKSGFTLIELSLVLTILGLLLIPLTRTLETARQRRQTEATGIALSAAKEALLAYAVQHEGCLPFAADFEGGLPDTGRDGLTVGAMLDTGRVRNGIVQRAGDIPWAALSLGGLGLDGRQLRLQYFVASAFTGDHCAARLRSGIEIWKADTVYHTGDIVTGDDGMYVAAGEAAANISPPTLPWQPFANGTIKSWRSDANYNIGDYVIDSTTAYRALANNNADNPLTSPLFWRAVGLPGQSVAPAWQSGIYYRGELVSYDGRLYRAAAATAVGVPAGNLTWDDISLPNRLLQTRLGPVIDTAPGNIIASAQNIAILIAPSRTVNTTLNRTAMRSPNHRDCAGDTSCSAWASLNDVTVDTRAFSLAPAPGDNPAATEVLVPVSLAEYQAVMARGGIRQREAVSW